MLSLDKSQVALGNPPSPYIKAEQSTESRGAVDLIRTEWKVIDSLLGMVEGAKDDNKKAYIYQTLMGHVRTLSMLLKAHGQKDQSNDLANVLSEITKDAKTKAKRLKNK